MDLLGILQVWPPFGTSISTKPEAVDYPLRRTTQAESHIRRTWPTDSYHLRKTTHTDTSLRRR